MLLRVQGDLQHCLHPILAHNGRNAQAQVPKAVLPLQHHGDRQHGRLVFHDALGNAGYRHSDAVVGGALSLNDGIGAVPHLLFDSVQLLPVVEDPPQLAKPVQVHAGDIGAAPHRKLAVPVLPNDGGVDVPAVHPQGLPQQILQPRGVQHRPGADHMAGRQAGQPPGRIGEHIHRVGHHQQNPLEQPPGQLWDDAL